MPSIPESLLQRVGRFDGAIGRMRNQSRGQRQYSSSCSSITVSVPAAFRPRAIAADFYSGATGLPCPLPRFREGDFCSGDYTLRGTDRGCEPPGRRRGSLALTPRTVAKMLAFSVPPGYRRSRPPARPKLDPFTGIIDGILTADEGRPRKQRHTSKRIFERFPDEHGYSGGITIVNPPYSSGGRG